MHAPFSNFYNSAAMVGKANSTNSAAGWQAPLPVQSWKRLDEARGQALPDSSGRG